MILAICPGTRFSFQQNSPRRQVYWWYMDIGKREAQILDQAGPNNRWSINLKLAVSYVRPLVIQAGARVQDLNPAEVAPTNYSLNGREIRFMDIQSNVRRLTVLSQ